MSKLSSTNLSQKTLVFHFERTLAYLTEILGSKNKKDFDFSFKIKVKKNDAE